MDDSELLHFFSYETKVSLELPIGWEEQEEDVGLAIYYYELEEENEEEENSAKKNDPRLIIKTFSISTDDPDALQKISQATLAARRIQQQSLSQSTTEVDGYPATVDVFTYEDEKLGCTLAQYQVFVQVSEIICSISGVAEVQDQQEFIPVFEQAVKSVRFIPV